MAGLSQAALVSDSTVTLTSRNFYLDRDYKGEPPYGRRVPSLPVITASPARLLPQSFRGVYLLSEDVPNATLHAGRMGSGNQVVRCNCERRRGRCYPSDLCVCVFFGYSGLPPGIHFSRCSNRKY